MGNQVQLQKLMGIENHSTGTGTVIEAQPMEGWLDLIDCEDVTLSICIFRRNPPADVKLVIQTATVPEGPWTAAATYDGATESYVEAKLYLSRHADGAARFERYVRWAVEVPAETTYKICFKIDGVAR